MNCVSVAASVAEILQNSVESLMFLITACQLWWAQLPEACGGCASLL